MPLILLTGFPASGKSTRAQQLREYFSTIVGKNVVLLSENEIVKNKHIYSGKRYRCYHPVYRTRLSKRLVMFTVDANKEKELRSTLKSELQRLISQEGILILDGGNYIKGIFFSFPFLKASYFQKRFHLRISV